MVDSDVALALQDLLGMELGMDVGLRSPMSPKAALVILATQAHAVLIKGMVDSDVVLAPLDLVEMGLGMDVGLKSPKCPKAALVILAILAHVVSI